MTDSMTFSSLSLSHSPATNFTGQARVTPSQCASACLGRSWCKSFDHYKYERRGDLSDWSAADVGGLMTDSAGHPFDHDARTPAVPQTGFALENIGRSEYFTPAICAA